MYYRNYKVKKMGIFNLRPTKIAEWQELIAEAETHSGYHFDVNIESYLVFTLDQFTQKDYWTTSIIAIDYLKALEISGRLGGLKTSPCWRSMFVIIFGLFPEHAFKKNVSLDYFVHIGQQAYCLVAIQSLPSNLDPKLFQDFKYQFHWIMDVLQTMRHFVTNFYTRSFRALVHQKAAVLLLSKPHPVIPSAASDLNATRSLAGSG